MFLDASWAPARRPGGAQDASRTRLGRARKSPGRVHGVKITEKIRVWMPKRFGERFGADLGGFLIDFGWDSGWIFHGSGFAF